MKLTSPAFSDHGSIPTKFTCDGDDINPQLVWSDVPENAMSLILIVDDPDAPRGDFVHWLVWNIDPGAREIAENSVPDGAVQGMTDFGRVGWGGPCPPGGIHRYFFKLSALDVILNLPASTRKKDLEIACVGHILAHAELIGLYARTSSSEK